MARTNGRLPEQVRYRRGEFLDSNYLGRDILAIRYVEASRVSPGRSWVLVYASLNEGPYWRLIGDAALFPDRKRRPTQQFQLPAWAQ